MPRRNHPPKHRRPQRALGDKRGRHKKADSRGMREKVRDLEQLPWWKPDRKAA